VQRGVEGRSHPRRTVPGPVRPADLAWAHIDLAASERKGGLAHVPTEFTGFGVRFATQLLGDGTSSTTGVEPSPVRDHAPPAAPDDWHLHLRDGAQLAAVLPFTAAASPARS